MWCSVKDKMPPRKKVVIIMDGNGNWGRGWHNWGGWHSSDLNCGEDKKRIILDYGDGKRKDFGANPCYLDLENIQWWMALPKCSQPSFPKIKD